MHTGMLWFDNSKSTLGDKARAAVNYYEKKYGRKPDLVLVHPIMFGEHPRKFELNGLTIQPYRPVLPGHIWVGIEDKEKP